MIHHQTAVEYFKELVEASLSRQRVRADDLTEFYLANLLCQYVRVDASPQQADDGQPLALRFARALECGGSEHRARLRGVGRFLALRFGFFWRQPCPPGCRRRLLSRVRRVRVRHAQPLRRRRFRHRVCGAIAKVRRLHGRPVGHQRSDDARICRRRPASIREVAAHGQSSRWAAARGARDSPESNDRPQVHPITSCQLLSCGVADSANPRHRPFANRDFPVAGRFSTNQNG